MAAQPNQAQQNPMGPGPNARFQMNPMMQGGQQPAGQPSLDDLAKQLAAAKTSYMNAGNNAQAQQAASAQGQQIRQQAQAAGLDLNQLGNMAQMMATGQGLNGTTSAYENEAINALPRSATSNQTGYQQPQSSGPFSLDGLSGLAGALSSAGGGDVPVEQARFQTPEQWTQLYNQMQQVLQPITNAQMKQQQDQFNGNMQNLDSKWAQRGLLATGAAAGAQANATNTLTDSLQKFQADQNGQALTMGNDYANLGLKEAQQIFDQQMANRNFDMSRAKNAFDSSLQGFGAQDANQKQMFDEGIQQGQLTGMYNGQQTLAAQDQSAKNAMALGQLTGTYMPPEAQGLLSQIMANKQAYASASPDKQKQLAAQNQQDYTSLSTLLGKDVTPLIGGNVGISQALANFGKLGTQTLGAGQLALDQQKEADQKQYQMGTLALDQEKTNNQENQFGQTLALDKYKTDQQNAQFFADLAFKKDSTNFTQNQSITKDQQDSATSGYLTQALAAGQNGYDGNPAGSLDSAMAYLTSHAQDIARDGADASKILAGLESVFPGATQYLKDKAGTAGTGTAQNPFSISPTQPGYQNQQGGQLTR